MSSTFFQYLAGKFTLAEPATLDSVEAWVGPFGSSGPVDVEIGGTRVDRMGAVVGGRHLQAEQPAAGGGEVAVSGGAGAGVFGGVIGVAVVGGDAAAGERASAVADGYPAS